MICDKFGEIYEISDEHLTQKAHKNLFYVHRNWNDLTRFLIDTKSQKRIEKSHFFGTRILRHQAELFTSGLTLCAGSLDCCVIECFQAVSKKRVEC